MNLVNDYNECITLNEYVEDDFIAKKLEGMDLSCNIQEGKLLVFSESWCSDCRINVTALKSILKQNKPDMSVCVLSREGNEELLYKLSGDERIPTIIFEDFKGNRRIFIERPKAVTDLLMNNQREIKANMQRYKQGELLQDSIDELSKLLCGK